MGKSFITWSSLFTSSVQTPVEDNDHNLQYLHVRKHILIKLKSKKRANLNKKKVNDIVYSQSVLNNLLLRLLTPTPTPNTNQAQK